MNVRHKALRALRALQDEFKLAAGIPFARGEGWWVPKNVYYPSRGQEPDWIGMHLPDPSPLQGMSIAMFLRALPRIRGQVLSPDNIARCHPIMERCAEYAARGRAPSVPLKHLQGFVAKYMQMNPISKETFLGSLLLLGCQEPHGTAKRGKDILDVAFAQQEKRMSARRQRSKDRQPLPLPSLRARLVTRVEHLAECIMRRCSYTRAASKWAPVTHTTGVSATCMGCTVTTPACTGSTDGLSWSTNGKWSGANSKHHIYVCPSWLHYVWSAKLAIVEGLFTLDARPVPGGYRASWARQGRGFGLVREKGYLVPRPDGKGWTHSKRAPKAPKVTDQVMMEVSDGCRY